MGRPKSVVMKLATVTSVRGFLQASGAGQRTSAFANPLLVTVKNVAQALVAKNVMTYLRARFVPRDQLAKFVRQDPMVVSIVQRLVAVKAVRK